MDDGKLREHGRHKADPYKSIHNQWMIPQHQLKDNQALKLMTIMTERDNAIQERNIALSEKKAAIAERDMAILQRDAAIAERNTAILERDHAIAALEYARENGMNENGVPGSSPGSSVPRGSKHMHHLYNNQQQSFYVHPETPPSHLADDSYNHSKEMNVNETYPVSAALESVAKARKAKRQRKDTKTQQAQAQATSPTNRIKSRKSKTNSDDLNKQAPYMKPLIDFKGEGVENHNEWKDQDLGLNLVTFDESIMPVPVCSCTGKYQPCYKWGNGGWQSACCTMTLSMYPLPVMPNKKHARVGGRKMSGSAFTKLLSRLAADGHDLSVPIDLKDHWSRHGTNRYITIK